jgi:hypothetical protein
VGNIVRVASGTLSRPDVRSCWRAAHKTGVLAGPHATGKWTGLQNGFANLSGVVAPELTGFLVDRTGKFLAPLAIAAAVLVAGGLAWMFAVGPVEQASWREQRRAPSAASSF